jgi:hypothetical protein
VTEQPLTLNQDECMVLTDRVRNDAADEGIPIGKPFLLKLSAAYLDLMGEKPTDATVTIWITEREAWLARSVLNSGDRTDRNPRLGVGMLRKLYTILKAFEAAEAIGKVSDAEEPDRTLAEVKQGHGWLPGEFGLGRANVEDVDDFDWKVGGLT